MSPHPFAHLPPTAASHFSLYFYAAVGRLLGHAVAVCGSWDELRRHCPFLAGYDAELAAQLPLARPDDAWWQDAIADWERGVPRHLPIRALRRQAGLGHEALLLLLVAGLPEEDARFGLLFEALQGPGQSCPSLGLLTAWWGDDPAGEARAALRQLCALGLLDVLNPEAPRSEWRLRPHALIWDALRGELPADEYGWLSYTPPEALTPLDELILPAELRRSMAAVPGLLMAGQAGAVIVRGPGANGRRTLLGALARALGRGRLACEAPPAPDDPRWRLLGPLALLLDALPAIALDLAPGETAELPALPGYGGPLGLALGPHGGVRGPTLGQALTLNLPLPDPAARRAHWRSALGPHEDDTVTQLGERFRMTGGNIRRAAGLARAYAALDGRSAVTAADVRQAGRALNRQALDTLATHVPARGEWSHLAVAPATLDELRTLERRCRNREGLRDALGAPLRGQLNCGVRALFGGPSGVGKTLAACLLATALEKDLYRIDLAAVVNKYIGETEKSLSRIFARAEELDVVLLLDEGDALLTRRTDVNSSNDRYANLETNYLLQRLESFEGILIVTSNAAGRIDGAFQRRMDVVIGFHSPGPAERAAIWRLHLPSEHAVADEFLNTVAVRCALSGGQIRNAVLHAALLALDAGEPVRAHDLAAAIEREYRKLGELCPLERGGDSFV